MAKKVKIGVSPLYVGVPVLLTLGVLLGRLAPKELFAHTTLLFNVAVYFTVSKIIIMGLAGRQALKVQNKDTHPVIAHIPYIQLICFTSRSEGKWKILVMLFAMLGVVTTPILLTTDLVMNQFTLGSISALQDIIFLIAGLFMLIFRGMYGFILFNAFRTAQTFLDDNIGRRLGISKVTSLITICSFFVPFLSLFGTLNLYTELRRVNSFIARSKNVEKRAKEDSYYA